MLPYRWLPVYDRLGIVSLFLMLFFGGRVTMAMINPGAWLSSVFCCSPCKRISVQSSQ